MEFPTSPDPQAGLAISPVGPRSMLPVLLAGAAATLAALLLNHLLLAARLDVMSWHLNYLIPIGALGLGFIATAGFGLATWYGGHRVTAPLLLAGAAVLALGYWGSEYHRFHRRFPEGRPYGGSTLGFWGSYELEARNLQFTGKSGRSGESLGALGLGARGLQVLGFVLGGLAAPLGMRKKSYCEPCGRYRANKRLAVVAAGIAPKVFGDGSPERVALRSQKNDAAQETLRAVMAAAEANDGAAVADRLQQDGPAAKTKEASAANARIHFDLASCERCGQGELVASMVTGQGKQIRTVPLVKLAVGPAVTGALRGR